MKNAASVKEFILYVKFIVSKYDKVICLLLLFLLLFEVTKWMLSITKNILSRKTAGVSRIFGR